MTDRTVRLICAGFSTLIFAAGLTAIIYAAGTWAAIGVVLVLWSENMNRAMREGKGP